MSDDPAKLPDPYRQALGLLVRREHSRRELRRKLDARGMEGEQAESAIDVLQRQGYQSDARFAEMLVRTRIGAGYGPMHIRAELGTHGIDVDTANAALEEAEPVWVDIAVRALQRRYGRTAARDRAESFKRGHYLQRRGFDGDTIRAAIQADLSA